MRITSPGRMGGRGRLGGASVGYLRDSWVTLGALSWNRGSCLARYSGVNFCLTPGFADECRPPCSELMAASVLQLCSEVRVSVFESRF
jgi:hypothetical protein